MSQERLDIRDPLEQALLRVGQFVHVVIWNAVALHGNDLPRQLLPRCFHFPVQYMLLQSVGHTAAAAGAFLAEPRACLLYTSDAADE